MMKLIKEFRLYLDNYERNFVVLDAVRTKHSDLLSEELEAAGHFVNSNVHLKELKKSDFWKKYPVLDWVVIQEPPERFPVILVSKLSAQYHCGIAVLNLVNTCVETFLDVLGPPQVLGDEQRSHWLIWSNDHVGKS